MWVYKPNESTIVIETGSLWGAAVSGGYRDRGARFHNNPGVTSVTFQLCSCKFNQNGLNREDFENMAKQEAPGIHLLAQKTITLAESV